MILGILPGWAEVLGRAYEAADLAPGWLLLSGHENHPPITYRDLIAAGGRAALDALHSVDQDLGPGSDGSGLQIGAAPADPNDFGSTYTGDWSGDSIRHLQSPGEKGIAS